MRMLLASMLLVVTAAFAGCAQDGGDADSGGEGSPPSGMTDGGPPASGGPDGAPPEAPE